MSSSFVWLHGDANKASLSLLDERIDYLERFLNGEPLAVSISHIIQQGLRERPLSFEMERYREFLALGAAAAWQLGRDHLESQCYQLLTGRRLRGSMHSTNHPEIRKHLSLPERRPALLGWVQHDWNNFKSWVRQFFSPR